MEREEREMTVKKPIGALPLDIAQRLKDDIDAAFDEFGIEIVRVYRQDLRGFERLEAEMRAIKGAALRPLQRRVKELAEVMFPEQRGGDACFIDEKGAMRNAEGTLLFGLRVPITDFLALASDGKFIHIPTRGIWTSAKPIDDMFPAIITDPGTAPRDWITVTASEWLNRHNRVEQVTWAPDEPMIIEDRVMAEGGWIDVPGARVFNLYRAPTLVPAKGDPSPWIDHVRLLYGKTDGERVIRFLAAMMQGRKINHALIMGGEQGIGKDTILAPVVAYFGYWNVNNIDPKDLLGDFNPI